MDRNRINIKENYENYPFLSRWRTHLPCIMIFHPIKELANMIGIAKNINPRAFRHSFATHLPEGDANLRAIQCMPGHESISTTEIYTHISRNVLRGEIIEYYPRNIKYRQEKRHPNKQQSLVWYYLKREIVLNNSGIRQFSLNYNKIKGVFA